jgi:hypothetical protein
MKDGSLNGKAPSSNTQIPNKSLSFLVKTWNLFGAWILGFEISDRLFFQGIDSLGQIKIKLRQAAFAVR